MIETDRTTGKTAREASQQFSLRPSRCGTRLLTMLALLLATGCGDSLESAAVGTVTVSGAPVEGVMMNWQTVGGGPGCYSMTDANGRFNMRTGSRDGILPGKYVGALQPPPGVEIPAKYGSIETSGLEFDVQPGKNEFEIEL